MVITKVPFTCLWHGTGRDRACVKAWEGISLDIRCSIPNLTPFLPASAVGLLSPEPSANASVHPLSSQGKRLSCFSSPSLALPQSCGSCALPVEQAGPCCYSCSAPSQTSHLESTLPSYLPQGFAQWWCFRTDSVVWLTFPEQPWLVLQP